MFCFNCNSQKNMATFCFFNNENTNTVHYLCEKCNKTIVMCIKNANINQNRRLDTPRFGGLSAALDGRLAYIIHCPVSE